MTDLLAVSGLSVTYRRPHDVVTAVDCVSFSLPAGGTLGIVGESGCGKTTLASALMGLLPPGGRVSAGRVEFERIDLAGIAPDHWRQIRWKRMSLIFQAAMNSLNPLIRVGDLLLEALTTHERLVRRDARARVVEMLEAVGIPPQLMWSYPHELSGGMRQRCIIALSLICRPALVIADEPTTAFDVILQDQILRLMQRLQATLGMAMIVISHDIGVIAEMCERVAVMYAGRIVEQGTTSQVFARPAHPYTQGLLASYPDLSVGRAMPKGIQGSPPSLGDLPSGCRFAPRCGQARPECSKVVPTDVLVADGHLAACLFAQTQLEGH